jgi:hypothetical protein
VSRAFAPGAKAEKVYDQVLREGKRDLGDLLAGRHKSLRDYILRPREYGPTETLRSRFEPGRVGMPGAPVPGPVVPSQSWASDERARLAAALRHGHVEMSQIQQLGRDTIKASPVAAKGMGRFVPKSRAGRTIGGALAGAVMGNLVEPAVQAGRQAWEGYQMGPGQ